MEPEASDCLRAVARLAVYLALLPTGFNVNMEQEILQLATQPLPVPVERQESGKGVAKDDSVDKENASQGQQQHKARRAEAPIVPYQAVPVTGETLITHNYTPALAVVEHEDMTSEVSSVLVGRLLVPG